MLISHDGPSLFNAACTAVAAGCAVWVALRDSRWRKNGLAKELHDRIDLAQKTAEGWPLSHEAVKLKEEVERQGLVLVAHDGALMHVATRTDMADLKGVSSRTEEIAKHAAAGVDRIEGILLRKALAGERV